MAKITELRIGAKLPVVGIVAFSGCSVNALANLLMRRAAHPTLILWFAAGLVELVMDWLVYQVVEQTRKVTRSNISKQDRRFYRLVLIAFVLLTVPSLGLSVWANALEFGSVALGFVFPFLSVGCAVGMALPDTVARFEAARQVERAEARAERNRKRATAEAEADRKRAEAEAEKARQEAATLRQRLENRGRWELAERIDRPLIWLYPLLYGVGGAVAVRLFLL
ncbi:MAG: hypothetical protein PVH59_14715 [Anaerolineae bacterium]|jgi:hypothetical protein